MAERKKNIFLCIPLLFFVFSCNLDVGDIKSFDYELQGTWVTNVSSDTYQGGLYITYDTIKITGYGEDQTPETGDDDTRPFRDFTKNAAFKGYSEDGKIFIEDSGLLQSGIPYIFYKSAEYPPVEFIRFTFGGKDQILRKEKDY